MVPARSECRRSVSAAGAGAPTEMAAGPVTYDDSLGFKWSKMHRRDVLLAWVLKLSKPEKRAGAGTRWPIQNRPKPGSHKPETYVAEFEMLCHLKSCMCDSRGSITCLLG